MHRHGRYPEAANYFEAMLEQDPHNPEAAEMLEQARQRMSNAPVDEEESSAQQSDPSQVSLSELLLEDQPEPLEFADDAADEEWGPIQRIRNRPILVAGGAVLLVATLIAAGAWYVHSIKPQRSLRVSEGPARRRSPVAAANAPERPRAASPDAGSLALSKNPSSDSASPVAISAPVSEPPASNPKWIEVKVERYIRPKIADLRAPATGLLRWKTASRHAVRRGEVVGNILENSRGRNRSLVAPNDGVLVPKAHEGARTRKAKKLGSLLSSQVELEALVAAPRPEKSWTCEVLSKGFDLKAPCDVETVESRGSGYWVKVRARSLEDFDQVPNPVLRLEPGG
jgi:hypothetical protein